MPVGDNETTTVNNHDIVFIADNITRFVIEAVHSASSGQSGINTFDVARFNSFLDSIDRAHDHVLDQPLLDLVETHPHPWPIEAWPVDLAESDVESEEINHLIRLWVIAWDELVNSQSARAGSGLNEFDSARLRSYVAKTRAFLADYVAETSPLDLPESSPRETPSGAGNRGVNPK